MRKNSTIAILRLDSKGYFVFPSVEIYLKFIFQPVVALSVASKSSKWTISPHLLKFKKQTCSKFLVKANTLKICILHL